MADSLKALQYAEQDLKVHEVYQSALTFRGELELALNELSQLRERKRELDSSLVDREMILVVEERGKHPDFSATAMEAHMRRVKNNDDEHREIREQIAFTLREIDDAENRKVLVDVDIKVAVARLMELGGYFEFLAAIKNHQANDASETEEQTA